MPAQLTKSACLRLRDPTDDDILTARPVVRVIAIEDRDVPDAALGVKDALVWDGHTCMHIALGPQPTAFISDEDGGLHVGSPVKLNRMCRLAGNDPCPILVKCLELAWAESDEKDDPDAMPLIVNGDKDDMATPTQTLEHDIERDNERNNARRRRRQLEHALADVCSTLGPGHEGGLVPSVVAMMKEMAAMANEAAAADDEDMADV